MRVAAPALLALLLACAPPLRGVHGWGAPGHMVTASLAERHLSAGAAAAAASDLQVLKPLYPTESEFVTAADWPDFIKASTTVFSQWHYIDLPYAPAGDGGTPPTCSDTQNIVWALENAAAVLRSTKSDPWSRSTMIRFLIHFMGDLHQPLHTASLYTGAAFPKGDEGGNALKLNPGVNVGSESVSELHAFWDNGCGHSGLESVGRHGGVVDRKAVDALAAQLDGPDVAALAAAPLGSTAEMSAAFKAWAAESHALAQNTSYAPALLADLGDGREAHTSAGYWADYEAQASACARSRLRLGGARLAQVLNSLHAAHGQEGPTLLLPPQDTAKQ